MNELIYRPLRESDHATVIRLLPAWWGGRDLTSLLPRIFFLHFNHTSFAVEADGRLVGFLVGFLSPAIADEAYIHFVGVAPEMRKHGVARELYRRFFALAKAGGRARVRCCTSPVNRDSIAFHRRLGFSLEPGDGEVGGVPVTLDFNRPGDHKVRFLKLLNPSSLAGEGSSVARG